MRKEEDKMEQSNTSAIQVGKNVSKYNWITSAKKDRSKISRNEM